MKTKKKLSRLGRWTGRVLLGTAVVAFALASVAGVAQADPIQYNLTQDNCTGGCNPGSPGTSMGTIVLAQNGTNDVQVTITLVDPLEFMSSGLDATIAFNLSGLPTISTSGLNTNFSLDSSSAGSYHMDGFGYFDYGIGLTTGTGASNAVDASPLTFDITCSSCGLTIGDFANLSTSGSSPAYFAIDVYNPSPTNGNTGAIGAVDPGTTVVPEAGTLSLLGTGLLGLFGLALYRRRSTSV